ncbi:MAG: signal peptidase I [Bdellovibrionaceae bacterium]|jgi:signal peptidase I|nr:signal peptidase I [Pseudobdellovibrionaceae bacterium]
MIESPVLPGLEATKDLRTTWAQAIFALFTPLLLVVLIRWLLIEPFVIPSGSMLPTLLVRDHVLVNKAAYGWRLPLQNRYVWSWASPQRGDIIVFRYPQNPEMFYVKRVIGLPGEKIEWRGHEVWINGSPLPQQELGDGRYQEQGYVLEYKRSGFLDEGEFQLGADEYFVMGDHRDQSADSRVWGAVKRDLIIGRVAFVWLSCERFMDEGLRLCDPTAIRWDRFGYRPK